MYGTIPHANSCSFQESVRKDCLRLKAETLDLQEEFGWCRQSIVDWKSHLREVYIDWSQRNSRVRIGGPGKIVEIDEAKVGKRKYKRGRVVKGQWVFGGTEGESGDFFILPVDCRNSLRSLLSIIKDRIADGTTIKSDCWKAYNCVEDKAFVHQAVNHSKNFDVPRFGRSKKHFVGYLARFEFRKKFKSIKERRHELFMAIGRLYDPNRDPSVAGDAQGCSDDDDDDVDDVDNDDYDDDDYDDDV
ncbi:hypothetical protein ACLKA7_007599 [Drosophila subpalustris]